ncbi:uncharacterized protein LAJ45_08222 [Morchella importuna]|uniref:uncharacterized protein n=1 Tax=Morchella importuna TaxID=1174673 RepID=UPI001E8DD68D|nr:uncharacterized protein LAJ45_08222 [Morchella importuna]KAH8147757.1 hypothetical protein LAJ45_08222 [Morchella importuna]
MKSLKTLCAELQQIFMLNGSYSLFNSKGEGGVRKSNVANQGSLFERCVNTAETQNHLFFDETPCFPDFPEYAKDQGYLPLGWGFQTTPMILCLDIRPDIFEPLLGDGSVSQLLLNNHDLHPLSIRPRCEALA